MSKVLTTTIRFQGLDQASRVIAGLQANVNRAAGTMAAASAKMRSASQAMTFPAITAAFGLKSITDSAIEAEQSVTQLKKFVSGIETPEAFRKLRADLDNVSESLGKSRTEMNLMAADLGKLGVATIDIPQIAELGGKVSVAWELPDDEVAASLARIQNAFKLSVADVQRYGDMVNHLGDNFATTSAIINESVRRMSPFSAPASVSVDMTSAAAAIMAAAGHEASRVETAWKKLSSAISGGDTLEKSRRDAMASIGVDAVELQKMTSEQGGDAALMHLLTMIGEIEDATKRLAITREIFGEEGAGPLLSLVNDSELLLKTYRDLQNEIAAGSVDREFGRQADTAAHKSKQLSAAWTDLKAAFGEALIPGFKDVTKLLRAFARQMESTPGLARMVTASLAGIVIAPVALRGLAALTSGLSMLTRVSSLALSPVWAIGRAMALMAASFAVSKKTGKLLASAKKARTAFKALAASMVLMTPIGLAAAGIGAAIYKSWDSLKALAPDLASAWGHVGDAFNAALKGDWKALSQNAGKAFGDLQAAAGKFFAIVDKALPSFRGFRSSIAHMGEAVRRLWNAFGGGPKADNLAELAQQLGDATFKAASNIIDSLAAAVERLSKAVEAFRGSDGVFSGLVAFAKEAPALTALGAALIGGRVVGGLRGLAGAARALKAAGAAGVLRGVGSSLSRMSRIKLGGALALFVGAAPFVLPEGLGKLAGDLDAVTIAFGVMAALDVALLVARLGPLGAVLAGAAASAGALVYSISKLSGDNLTEAQKMASGRRAEDESMRKLREQLDAINFDLERAGAKPIDPKIVAPLDMQKHSALGGLKVTVPGLTIGKASFSGNNDNYMRGANDDVELIGEMRAQAAATADNGAWLASIDSKLATVASNTSALPGLAPAIGAAIRGALPWNAGNGAPSPKPLSSGGGADPALAQ